MVGSISPNLTSDGKPKAPSEPDSPIPDKSIAVSKFGKVPDNEKGFGDADEDNLDDNCIPSPKCPAFS